MEIKDYEDYLIYNDGLVFSKKRNIFMKTNLTRDGYEIVQISNKNGVMAKTIHRLVAIHYLPNPQNKPTVDHINRIKTDNRVENLRWATHSENNLNKGLIKTNTSGFKNITKQKSKSCKQGFFWCFRPLVNGKKKVIKVSIDKEKLIEFAEKWYEENNYYI